MWRIAGKGKFIIVEYGAGTGAQCDAILSYLKNFEEFFSQLEYCIIEKNNANLPVEFQTNEKIRLLNSLDELENFNGVVLANEVLDNFPVHQVVMEEELMEIFVEYNDGFHEIKKPAAKELKDYFSSLKVELIKGFRTEVNLDAINWLKEISDKINTGFVLTIDYGFLSDDLYSPKRSNGTILCYHRHRINDQPYNFIGDQDITAHVNFSALVFWGKQFGLIPCGYTDQSNFLLALGLTNHLRNIEIRMGNDPSSNKEDIFLLYKFLAEMGKKFRVLIQQKGMTEVRLMGMQFGKVVDSR
jgi:SAM-dependent MidA family methyltransferase